MSCTAFSARYEAFVSSKHERLVQLPHPPSQNSIMLLVLWGHDMQRVLSNR